MSDTRSTSRFILVAAPGHYGDRTTVLSSHSTLAAAKRARGRDASIVIRESSKRRGEEWLRVYEQSSPVVGQEVRS